MGNLLLRNLIIRGLASGAVMLWLCLVPLTAVAQVVDSSKARMLHESGNPKPSLNSSYGSQLNPNSFNEIDTSNISSKIAKNKPVFEDPAAAFKTRTMVKGEGDGSFRIEVELLESVNHNLSIEVSFLAGQSTASSNDLNGYTSHALTFVPNDPVGTTEAVEVFLTDDDEFEGEELAVFILQNNTGSSLEEPNLLKVTINDNDLPDIVINEFYVKPADGSGDANGDGTVNSSQDEFIEIVNNEEQPIDLSGWTVSDDLETRFIFPSGAVIAGGTGAVIFGGGKPTGNFGGSKIFTAARLDLDDNGDAITLRNEREEVITQVVYGGESGNGSSITRSRDVTGRLGIRHSQAEQSGSVLYSPGTKIDGTSFGSKFSTGFRGNEGWRLISSPTRNTTFKDLFESLRMQGASGSDAPTESPTIYRWDPAGGGNFQPVRDMDEVMIPGRGYAVYLFEDDEPALPNIQGGFPKILKTDLPENNAALSIQVSALDAEINNTRSGNEGWNLLGNPFGEEISVDALLASVRRSLQIENPDYRVNGHVYVWDPSANGGNGKYRALAEGSGNVIAPFQAFWIRLSNGKDGSAFSLNVSLERSELIADNIDRRYRETGNREFGFKLLAGDGTRYDEFEVLFNPRGSLELEADDAHKLFPLNPDAIALSGLTGQQRLMKNSLPIDLKNTLEIPVQLSAPGGTSLEIYWEGLESIPDNWNVTLLDRERNREVNLRTASNYEITLPEQAGQSRVKEQENAPRINQQGSKYSTGEPRFILTVSPGTSEQLGTPDIPESVKLNPNYPNPFNPATTISYELKEDSEVLLSIWNIVGQKVVTLVEGMKEAGEHTATWNASDMPSGIYIAQLEVGGEVFIRKMTLIK